MICMQDKRVARDKHDLNALVLNIVLSTKLIHVLVPVVVFVAPILDDLDLPHAAELFEDTNIVGVAHADEAHLPFVLEAHEDIPRQLGLF